MLIVIEGCDGTGKTTLAHLLQDTIGGKIIHCSTYTPNTFTFFQGIVTAATKEIIIADRFCYGQFVYQEEKDRPLGVVFNSMDTLHRLEALMTTIDTKLIYCCANTDTIHSRLYERGEQKIDVEDIQRKYQDLWKKTLIQPIYYRT